MAETSLNPFGRFSPPRQNRPPSAAGPRDPAAPHRAHEPGIHQALVERAIPEIIARLGMRRRDGVPASPVSPASQRARPEALVDALFDANSLASETIARADPSWGDPQLFARTLLEPAARLIGERWTSDERDFMEVTIALSRIQRLFDRSVSQTPPICVPDPDMRLLLANAPGEQHGFGLSVVEDAFRRAGWTVDRCVRGEGSELFRLAASCRYRIIGISIAGEASSSGLKALVTRLRARSLNRSVVMLAGGALVARDPDYAVRVGFDLAAADLDAAIRLASTVAPLGEDRAARKVRAA